jgi:hypothetical protein
MRKYGCPEQKWLRDKLSHVFSEEKNKNNKQNIKKARDVRSATTNISQEREKPVLFILFFSCFSLFCVALRLFLKNCLKKIEKMKKKKLPFLP